MEEALSQERVAVIGSGISGLGAAFHLSNSKKFDVHLFEAKSRLGGHSYTIDVQMEGRKITADMGFLVYNQLTYPHLIRLFEKLNIESHPSDMSFSVQIRDENMEWNGSDLMKILIPSQNHLRREYYRMLNDILDFNKNAVNLLKISEFNSWSLGNLISNTTYSREFYEWYLIPMGAAIWSTPFNKLLDFPAETFLRFFINHRLLQVKDRPQWMSPIHGARDYVNKMAAKISNIHLDSPITSLERVGKGWHLRTAHVQHYFDKIIFATSGEFAYEITKEVASRPIQQVLKHFKTCENKAVLHTDIACMPKRKRNWAAWNYHRQSAMNKECPVSLTYWLNPLKGLQTKSPLFVTLNPHSPIKENRILHEQTFNHPMFDRAAVNAQKELPLIQGTDNLWFCGAWTRYGFHEDGYLSALNVLRDFLPDITVEKTPEKTSATSFSL